MESLENTINETTVMTTACTGRSEPQSINNTDYKCYSNLLSNPPQTKEEQIADLVTKDVLPLGRHQLNMISANGGGYKSFVALRVAMNYTATEEKKALCIFTEDAIQQVVNRIHLVKEHEASFDDSKLNIMSVESDIPSSVETLKTFIENVSDEIGLIVLDPLLAFYNKDENNNVEAKGFMDQLSRTCRKHQVTLLILHHSAKNTVNSRGAGAFTDACRVVYHAAEEANGGINVRSMHPKFTLFKDNIGIKYLTGELEFIIPVTQTSGVIRNGKL